MEIFSAWFGTAITEAKKCVGLRESKLPFSDWNWKILIWLKHNFYRNICFWESLTLLIMSQKVEILKLHEKSTPRNAAPVNCYICYLRLNLWTYFDSISCFYTWHFLTIPGNCFFFYKLIKFIKFIIAICLPGLNGSFEYFPSP